MGAQVDGRADGKLLPLVIRGGGLKGIEYTSPVASAQIKSCVLLAAMGAAGTTRFTEPSPSRDHTERMLDAMGIVIGREKDAVTLEGGQIPRSTTIAVPGDISSAAFFLVAAAVVEGSDVTVVNTGINPTRKGIVELLKIMGADITITPVEGGVEPRADIRVRGTRKLKGVRVPEEWIPSIIDELPLAGVLGACAEGTTVITGAGELRVKESDRISSTVEMISNTGAVVAEERTGFTVTGSHSLHGAKFSSHGDHRIAMSCVILSLASEGASEIKDTACVATSFPDFPILLDRLSQGSISILQDN
jgi:3-phosphoshikimate 1-carboxyvinyltransferase